MMIGEVFRRHVPTVHIPNWEPDPSPYTTFSSPPSSNSCHYYTNTISIPANEYSSPSRIPLSDYSPSSITDYAVALHHHYSPTSPRSSTSSTDPNQYDYDSFPSDSFRIYDFKVRRCVRGRSHDWTECPFAHPGEKARRRDPRKFHYSGTPCPDFRKGVCRKGDGCEFAHGVFECWLHPQRYRTQPCKDGIHCSRRVCFFAHTPEQLRLSSDDGPGSSPQGKMGFLNDQLENRNSGGFESVNELVGRMNDLHLQGMDGCGGGGGKAVVSPRCWGFQLSNSSVTTNSGGGGGGFGSPRSGSGLGSLQPSTPTQKGSVRGLFDTTGWSNLLFEVEEEPVIERVESGRDIRARMYAKLRGDNSLDRPESPFCPIPDFGWVSELVK